MIALAICITVPCSCFHRALEGFYATPGLGRNEIRLCYALEKAKLERAAEIIRAGLRAYGNRKGGLA